MHTFTRSGSLLRALAIIALMVTNISFTTGATAQFDEGDPDLAAMLLRSPDYDALGLDGDVVRYSGSCQTAPQYAAEVAASYGMAPAAMASRLEEIGLGDTCEAYHGVPSDPTQRSAPLVFFRSYVHHFADDDAAAEGFAFLEDESDDPTHTDIPEGTGLGDESEASVSAGEDEGGAYQMIDVSFRLGSIEGGVSIRDYTGTAPDPNIAFGLANEMIDRIDAAQAGDTPNLGSLLAPMAGEGLPPLGIVQYQILDGVGETNLGESAEAFDERIASWRGAVNVYFFGQVIPPAKGERPVQYAVALAEFGSDDEAVAFVEEALQRRRDDEENFDIVENTDVGQYGDASVAIHYGSMANGTESQLDRMYVAIDNYVLSSYLVYTTVPAGVIEPSAAIQVACIEADGCSDTVPVPEAFGGPPAATTAPNQENAGEDDESADSSGTSAIERIGRSATRDEEADDETNNNEDRGGRTSSDESYESDTHPYTIAFSDDWAMEDPQVIGDMEILTMSNGQSGVVIIVDTAHDGDVEACLDGALAYVEDQDDVTSVEVMEDENGDPLAGFGNDVAYTAIAYELEDGSEMALYAECRTVVHGDVTMEFNQFVPLDAFEDEADAREELLAGIQIDN